MLCSLGMFIHPQIFKCNTEPEFKSDVTKLLDEKDVDIRRTTTRCKHTRTAFLETINKKLEKQLFKSMESYKLHQGPKKVL